jgi:hypothetical protein
MNDPTRWSPVQDPPRDDTLARLLRQADGTPPDTDVDWERLHAAVMRGAVSRGGLAAAPPREWWDVVVQWRRVAVAASVAAMLGAGAVLWSTGLGSSELASGDEAAPESLALARVVADYPDDAVFTSLIQTARNDDFTSWGEQ